MLSDITIGQYFPGNSLLYKLDPRTKIMALLILITAIFMVDTGMTYSILISFTIITILLSQLPIIMLLKSIKPLLWIILFTVLIHLFTTPGITVYRVWFLTITQEGIAQAALISTRLVLLILLSSILTFTTSPLSLTDGLENLLNPLKRFGVPAHELAMMMTIALRFIPTLLEETDRIMKAQESRGADFTTGSLKKRVQHMIPLLVPLFISAFRRADDLAVAMEARCYRGGDNRTRMKELKLTHLDYQAYTILALLFVILLGFSLYGD